MGAALGPQVAAPNKAYRTFRFPWSGRPAAAAERTSGEEVRVHASWTGATEVVAIWEILAGPNPGQLKSVRSEPRYGFETALLTRTAESYVALRARDRSGQVLGAFEPIKPES